MVRSGMPAVYQSSLPILNLVFHYQYQFIKKVILSVDMIQAKRLGSNVRFQL